MTTTFIRSWQASAVMVAVVLAIIAGPLVQAQGPEAVLRASKASVGVGLTASVTLDVRKVQDLFGAEVSLSFDPDVVRVVDADPAKIGVQVRLGTFLEPGIVALNTADNAAGTINCAWTQVRPSEPKSGDGTLLVITFEGLQEGATTPVVIESATLVNSEVRRVALALEDGAVTVVAERDAPPTPTPGPEIRPAIPLPNPGQGRGAATVPASTSSAAGTPTGRGAAEAPGDGTSAGIPAGTAAGSNAGILATAGATAGPVAQGPAGAATAETGVSAAVTSETPAAHRDAAQPTWTVSALGDHSTPETPSAPGPSSDGVSAWGARLISLLLVGVVALVALAAWRRRTRGLSWTVFNRRQTRLSWLPSH